ncbi:oxygen-dependent coproporphyrinogen oxidase [Membranicola marinus]|uniref:coproporphyrinogen oxidase n=1 Tax=Membranihabitans marinus TaxID=1227546 RepID=A0A953L8G6_9BACT|nr:oxygen-dependent coproporphyrinogen oxidase [Membranihabitans marinus]MBY5959802.1 oxygen-dependent coproporphyrinogen oxidase [Membranihabitans marinus]
MIKTTEIISYFESLQDDICTALEKMDGKGRFREDLWEREGGGGGRTRIIHGAGIEKGGVNYSHVHGAVTPKMRDAMNMDGDQWQACGVSIVLHPVSPMVPIIHMNVRYFELDDGADWWFGGGIDLTPHYVDVALAKNFHLKMKGVCDAFDPAGYDKYKKWADDYFYIPHRRETRGVGGIFFDHLNEQSGSDKAAIFQFVQNVGEVFVPTYQEQYEATNHRPYGNLEKVWQMIRRGRYVEFNLVWDRGTKFGLISDGRTESILMSLPPQANWAYQYDESEDKNAVNTQEWLKKGVNWVDA